MAMADGTKIAILQCNKRGSTTTTTCSVFKKQVVAVAVLWCTAIYPHDFLSYLMMRNENTTLMRRYQPKNNINKLPSRKHLLTIRRVAVAYLKMTRSMNTVWRYLNEERW